MTVFVHSCQAESASRSQQPWTRFPRALGYPPPNLGYFASELFAENGNGVLRSNALPTALLGGTALSLRCMLLWLHLSPPFSLCPSLLPSLSLSLGTAKVECEEEAITLSHVPFSDNG